MCCGASQQPATKINRHRLPHQGAYGEIRLKISLNKQKIDELAKTKRVCYSLMNH
jgi:hypothetical protein